MTAEAIARGLGLKRSGHEWVGACPCCGYRAGFAVTERDGKLLVHCAVNKCDWTAIRGALVKLGLIREEPQMPAKPRAKKDTGEQGRGLWNRAGPAAMPNGSTTIVVDYFRSRDITVPVPPVLRFVSDCWHRSGVKAPAMIALVEHTERGPVAVHRTWLRPDGSGKADLNPNKMTLGPSDGAAIRLAPVGPHGELGVAEGIEDALSYMQLKGIPTWSALTAGGIERLVLPPEARLIYVTLDNDAVGLKAAQTAARRWLGEGRRVFFAKPPIGKDWNETLCALAREGAAV
jgi:putative DNA primase/helicase